MHLFFHLAMDHFGAECLGKMADLLADVTEPEEEHHFFIWAGADTPPEKKGFWDILLPSWDHHLWGVGNDSPYNRAEHGIPSFNLNRNELAGAVSRSFKEGATRDVLDEIFRDMPKKLFGNRTYEPTLTFSGSLADPMGSATLLGLFDGFRHLRELGVHEYPSYAVLGLGEDTSPVREKEEELRCLTGQALHDIEAFFKTPSSPGSKAVPVYLVGEKPIGNVASDRETQASLVASALLGISRSVLSDHQWPNTYTRRNNPFSFQSDFNTEIITGGIPWSAENPFHIVGAAIVRCPLHSLSKLLAAEFGVRFWEAMAEQKPPDTIEECALLELSSRDQESFVLTLEKQARSTFWTSIAEVYTQRVLDDEATGIENLDWFDDNSIENVLGTVFKLTRWKKILDWYTYERLRNMPLEDWSSAVDELIEVIENGFLPQRSHHIELVERRVLQLYIEAIDHTIDQIFRRTGRTPVYFSPHMCSLKLLGRIHFEINKVQDEKEKLARLSPNNHEMLMEQAIKGERLHRQKFIDAIDAVPSPAAVLVRFLPLFIACAAFIYLLPFDLEFVDTLIPRLGLSLIVGAGACLLLFWRHVRRVRKRLFKFFDIWFETFKKRIKLKDEAATRKAHKNILKYMDEVIQWFVEGKTDAPPLPDTHRIFLRKPPETAYWKKLPDEIVSRQTALRKPESLFKEAGNRYRLLFTRLKENIFSSYAERLLPSFECLNDVMSETIGSHDSDKLQAILAEIGANWPPGTIDPMVPYFTDDKNIEGGVYQWRRAFILPDEIRLMDPGVQKRSSALRFFQTIAAYFESKFSDKYNISAQVDGYLDEIGADRFPGSELDKLIDDLAQPSVLASGGERDTYNLMLVSQKGDPIATERKWSNNLGHDRLTILYRIQLNRSASDILEYPNPENPQTPLGKAWKRFKGHKLQGKAFAPVLFKADGAQNE